MEPEIRGLLSDVQGFLTSPGLKDNALNKTALAEKKRILEDIEQLRKKYPQLTFNNVPETPDELYEDPSEVTSSPPTIVYEDTETTRAPKKASTAARPTEKPPADDEIKPVAVIDIQNASKTGNLKKKEKKKLTFGMKKVYCVLCDGTFYYYDKNTSKKQNGAFYLKDYEARSSGPVTKKEFGFDLVKPGGTTYSFVAASSEEREDWIEIINNKARSGVSPTVTKPLEIPYEDTGVDNTTQEEDDQLYEETEPRIPSPVTRKAPEKPKANGKSKTPPVALQTRPPPVKAPPPRKLPPDPVEDEYYDDTEPAPQKTDITIEDDDDIYDDTEEPAAVANLPLPPPPKKVSISSLVIEKTSNQRPESVSSSFSAGYRRPALPPRSLDGGTIDYSNMYYGLWDYKSDKDDELSFKRGDIIQVINKAHDKHEWWIGRLDHNMGLIPKTYLTSAYRLAR